MSNYNSTLQSNNTDLQAILNIINELPEAGGGGLPEGITALASGTYTQTSRVTSPINVEHDLGVKPNFCVWIIENNLTAAPLASAGILGCLIEKPAIFSKSVSTIYNATVFAASYNASSALQRTAQTIEAACHTDTTCRIWANAQYCLAAGYTYRWVCGLIEGVL